MRLIDADTLIADCQLAQKQADRHGREFANAFYSGGGEVSTEWWCVEDMIENAPTIEPEQKWIPCSVRLPEANGRYLVTRGLSACGSLWNRVYIANYSDLMGLKRERIWWQGNVGKSDFERIDDVLAWMPLPECYQEDI